MRASDLQKPVKELPIEGRVVANGRLGDDPAAIVVRYSQTGIDKVLVHLQQDDCTYELTYELSRTAEQPDQGERWETSRLDPEATVEIWPVSEIEMGT